MSNTVNPNTPPNNPWHKEKWVWLIIGIPATSVVLGIIMITLAVTGRDSLVKDDYYKEGRAINFELKKDQLAKQLGLQGVATLNEGQIVVKLTANSEFIQPASVTLLLIHPTLANADMTLTLLAYGDAYIGEFPALKAGRRYLHLTDPETQWRLKGESWLPSSQPIPLVPAVPKDSSTTAASLL